MEQINQINYSQCSCRVKGYKSKDYTIEEHLRQFRDDEHYKVLYDSWVLEKKMYENRLEVTGVRYQTYSCLFPGRRAY